MPRTKIAGKNQGIAFRMACGLFLGQAGNPAGSESIILREGLPRQARAFCDGSETTGTVDLEGYGMECRGRRDDDRRPRLAELECPPGASEPR